MFRHFAVENEDAFHSEPGSGGRGLTTVIRLQGTTRNQGLGSLRLRFADQEFQFPRLVPAKSQASQIVSLY